MKVYLKSPAAGRMKVCAQKQGCFGAQTEKPAAEAAGTSVVFLGAPQIILFQFQVFIVRLFQNLLFVGKL